MGTTFSVEKRNSPSTESKLNQFHPDGGLNGPFKGLPKKRHRLASSGMELPETVSYRNLTARITHSAKDGLYHAYWNCGGHRGKAASKKFERAKGKALAALKLIQKGHACDRFLPSPAPHQTLHQRPHRSRMDSTNCRGQRL